MPTKSKPKFKTSRNFNQFPKNYKRTTGKTVTIQGETLSVKQMLQKHSQGIMIGSARTGIYDEDPQHDHPDFSKINGMDLVEQEQIQADLLEQEVSKKRRKRKAQKTEEQNNELNDENTEEQKAAPPDDLEETEK